jgi:hypothetical protein
VPHEFSTTSRVALVGTTGRRSTPTWPPWKTAVTCWCSSRRVGKLSRLPIETQKALQQLACLGNSADFALLSVVYEDSEDQMHSDLRKAVEAGLVLHSEGAYRFLHDRVRRRAGEGQGVGAVGRESIVHGKVSE